jgi:hypothetical protein
MYITLESGLFTADLAIDAGGASRALIIIT